MTDKIVAPVVAPDDVSLLSWADVVAALVAHLNKLLMARRTLKGDEREKANQEITMTVSALAEVPDEAALRAFLDGMSKVDSELAVLMVQALGSTIVNLKRSDLIGILE